ncbi:hypothetical protein LP7551_00337 [Roseibium album]|nr:hypothetical protein LP7551_00337 [Roseibium album]
MNARSMSKLLGFQQIVLRPVSSRRAIHFVGVKTRFYEGMLRAWLTNLIVGLETPIAAILLPAYSVEKLVGFAI